MAITVTLAPELETEVHSVAKQEGLTADTYIGKLLQRDLYHRRVTVSEDEQQELGQIIDQREEANVHRIEALIKLAQLRNTTLDALIDELGIRPALYV